MLEYRGYTGRVEFDEEKRVFHGEVLDLGDVITFQGRSVDELERAFQDSIDDYLQLRAKRGESEGTSPDEGMDGEILDSPETMPQQETLPQNSRRDGALQVELLISAGFVLTLLQAPDFLHGKYMDLELHLSGKIAEVFFYGYYFCTLIAYTLIFSFISHLLLRSYWVGLVGLRDAFPEGIHWDKVKYGPAYVGFMREHTPSISTLIAGAERSSRMVFAFCAILVLMLLFGLFFLGLLVVFGIALNFLFPQLDSEKWTLLLFAVFYVLFIVVLSLDKMSEKYPVVVKPKWMQATLRRFIAFFSGGAGSRIVSALYLTFSTNVPKMGVRFFLIFMLPLGAFFLLFMVRLEKLHYDGYLYYVEHSAGLNVDFRYYADQRPEGELYREIPSIQSDVIAEPYVRLVVPYSPRRHNEDLAEMCPETDPLVSEGVRPAPKIARKSEEVAVTLSQVDALKCLSKLYEVQLNGKTVDTEWNFYRPAGNHQRGIITYLPTDGLPSGRQLLEVNRNYPLGDEGWEQPLRYAIPFWTP